MVTGSQLRFACALILAALLATGCTAMRTDSKGASPPSGTPRVTGTVTYLQRIALPPTALIKVQLADVSRADAPAIVLGEALIRSEGGQVPFPFSIPYDPAKIDQRFTYAVSARIEDGGKLLFITDTRYPVLTRGAPSHVELVLRQVGGAGSR
jgi:putative lipoprotein